MSGIVEWAEYESDPASNYLSWEWGEILPWNEINRGKQEKMGVDGREWDIHMETQAERKTGCPLTMLETLDLVMPEEGYIPSTGKLYEQITPTPVFFSPFNLFFKLDFCL